MSFIQLNKVTLDFPVYGTSTRSLKRQFLRVTTGGIVKQDENDIVTVRALNDLSFNIQSGDVVGLIGHNGAGKSTLLRLLAGIYQSIQGEMWIEGRVSALLDITLGMDDESTGYENIKLNGIIRGLTSQQILAKRQEIADFTGLGDYLSMPVRTYSNGMRLRLAFSIVTSLSSEILLLDEIVGVGDTIFMDKAQRRLIELISRSEIVVFASHTEELIRKFCNKILWLNAGKVVYYGELQEGLERYKEGL